MALTIDEHRDLVNGSIVEIRAAIEELAKLNGIHVSADTAPAIFAALKASNSCSNQLARFVAEVEVGRESERTRSLREQEVKDRDERVRAESYKAQVEEAAKIPRDRMGYPVGPDGKPVYASRWADISGGRR